MNTSQYFAAALTLAASLSLALDPSLSHLVTTAKAKLDGLQVQNELQHHQAAQAFFRLNNNRPAKDDAELAKGSEYLDLESKKEQEANIEGALPQLPASEAAPPEQPAQ